MRLHIPQFTDGRCACASCVMGNLDICVGGRGHCTTTKVPREDAKLLDKQTAPLPGPMRALLKSLDMKLRTVEFEEMKNVMLKVDNSLYEPAIWGILATEEILNRLSKSGVPQETKLELSEMAPKVWKGWQINLDDIEFVRKPNGDRKRIGKGGAANVYLGTMAMHDVTNVEAACKEFSVQRVSFHRYGEITVVSAGGIPWKEFRR